MKLIENFILYIFLFQTQVYALFLFLYLPLICFKKIFPELFVKTEYLSDIGLRVKHCFVDNKLKNQIYSLSYKDQNVLDFIKLEVNCILLRKPILCKQKDFDYTVFLFS